jgi:hypothetical protein
MNPASSSEAAKVRVRVHANPTVSDTQLDVIARFKTSRMLTAFCNVIGLGAKDQRAAIGHGIARIGAQIDYCRLQLSLVSRQPRHIRRDIGRDRDGGAKRVCEHLAHIIEQLDDVDCLGA